jgi:hypothetical protein
MLYKYRSLRDFRYLEDIIKNKRLYAARYDDLNDRDEGHFYYNSFDYSEETLKAIRRSKLRNRVLSLSRNANEELMWGHYADGHRGIVIGVEVDSDKYQVKPIEYTHDLIRIGDLRNGSIEELVKRVLMQKNVRWSYEEEERVFARHRENFVSVSIEEIIIGSRVSNEYIEKINKLVTEFYPSIIIKNLKSD